MYLIQHSWLIFVFSLVILNLLLIILNLFFLTFQFYLIKVQLLLELPNFIIQCLLLNIQSPINISFRLLYPCVSQLLLVSVISIGLQLLTLIKNALVCVVLGICISELIIFIILWPLYSSQDVFFAVVRNTLNL